MVDENDTKWGNKSSVPRVKERDGGGGGGFLLKNSPF